MKKIILITSLSISAIAINLPAAAQADELKQLMLDLEKLAQLKQILTDLKKGYDILSGGYTTIKDIAEGNFNLHKGFLDGLLAVSPAVKNYKRVADIVNAQLALLKEYKSALKRFRADNSFNAGELDYITTVYSNLAEGSLKNLDALAMVITAGRTRMSDDERISAIDHIYIDMEDKLSFLRWFNNSATVLSVQRAKELSDTRVLKEIYNTR